ncbi:MAG: hypothetical protein WD266_01445 [Balneolales bacterium]
MEYRSFGDLSRTITANLHKIPDDVDLVAGIPRSGLLAGNLIASFLNLPVTDLDGFFCNRSDSKHVLVVDDTVYGGKSMAYARKLIREAFMGQRITFCTVYAHPRSVNLVDICFETLTSPGCQEWNIMHRNKLNDFCMDIDGVLCRNPEKAEDDDGPAYRHFLNTARPLMLPSHRVGYLVTGRLEKYRKETEVWLSRHHILYDELCMLDLPDAKTRWKLNASAKYKAEVYKSHPQSLLFIESEQKEAGEIARMSGKRVLCFYNQKIYIPPTASLIRHRARRFQSGMVRKAGKMALNLKSLI